MPTQEEIKAKLREKYSGYKQRAEERGNFVKTDHWNPHIVQVSDVNDEGDEIRIVPYPFISQDEGVPALSFEEVVMQGKRKIFDKDTKTYTIKESWLYLASPSAYGCPDPIREFRNELKKSTDPDDKALYKRLAPKETHVCLVYEIKHPEKGLQIWKFGAMVMEQLLKWAAHSDYAVPWDPAEGQNLWVKRTGKGLDTEYTVTPRPMRTPMPEREKLEALAAKIDLAWQVQVDTAETLSEVLATDIYDEKLARERRDERDKTIGRPVPLFIQKKEGGTDAPATAPKTETPAVAPPADTKRRPGRPAGSTNKPPAEPPPTASAPPPGTEKKDDIPMYRFKAEDVIGRKITFSLDGESQQIGKCKAYDGSNLTVVDLDDVETEVPEDNVIEVGPAKAPPKPPAEPPPAPPPPPAEAKTETPPAATPPSNAVQSFKEKMAAMRAAAAAKAGQ